MVYSGSVGGGKWKNRRTENSICQGDMLGLSSSVILLLPSYFMLEDVDKWKRVATSSEYFKEEVIIEDGSFKIFHSLFSSY